MADFLDFQGRLPNFLTGQPYSDRYRTEALWWSKLPLYQPAKLQEFIECLMTSQVVFVSAGTGSGKSQVLPRVLLRYLYHTEPDFKAKVAMTIPKREPVRLAAKAAADTLDVELGTYVDYGFRGHSVSRTSQLRFLTDGILLSAILHGDRDLSQYDAVIIDEAHERPVPTDLLMYYLRDILRDRPEFKVVIMSATIDPAPFLDYFKDVRCRVLDIGGKPNYPIQEYFADQVPPSKQALGAAADCVAAILTDPASSEGDVLVFVPSIKDTRNGCVELARRLPAAFEKSLFCSDLHAGTSDASKELVLNAEKYKDREAGSSYTRKVVFSTNVAESSVTIQGLTYVVDTGLEVQVVWDPLTHGPKVWTGFVTRGQMTQRIGRVGRKGPGVAYRLYTPERMAACQEFPDPRILQSNLCDPMMMMIAMANLRQAIQVFTHLLTPPTTAQIVGAVNYLHCYGLIEVSLQSHADTRLAAFMNKRAPASFPQMREQYRRTDAALLARLDGTTTILGEVYLHAQTAAQTNLEFAMLILWGLVFDCIESMIILASILETLNGSDTDALWDVPLSKADTKKDKQPPPLSPEQVHSVLHESSDHLTLVNVYEQLFLQGDVANLASGTWKKIHDKAHEHAHIAHTWLDGHDDLLLRLRKQARVPALSSAENAILAARCFNLCCVTRGGTAHSIYPLKSSSARVAFLFGGAVAPAQDDAYTVAVYESVATSAAGTSFGLVTAFPGLTELPSEVHAACADAARRGKEAPKSRKQ